MDSQKSIKLHQLSLPQLEQLKNQIEDEVNLLTSSMTQLKAVQQKLNESRLSVTALSPDSEGKEILVPLSASMYVPGKLCKPDLFLCDVGTGYYVEKNQKQTAEYFQRRIDYVTSNIEKLQVTLVEKYKAGESIVGAMQAKIQTQQQAQKNKS